jgi:hypothetical protein
MNTLAFQRAFLFPVLFVLACTGQSDTPDTGTDVPLGADSVSMDIVLADTMESPDTPAPDVTESPDVNMPDAGNGIGDVTTFDANGASDASAPMDVFPLDTLPTSDSSTEDVAVGDANQPDPLVPLMIPDGGATMVECRGDDTTIIPISPSAICVISSWCE